MMAMCCVCDGGALCDSALFGWRCIVWLAVHGLVGGAWSMWLYCVCVMLDDEASCDMKDRCS